MLFLCSKSSDSLVSRTSFALRDTRNQPLSPSNLETHSSPSFLRTDWLTGSWSTFWMVARSITPGGWVLHYVVHWVLVTSCNHLREMTVTTKMWHTVTVLYQYLMMSVSFHILGITCVHTVRMYVCMCFDWMSFPMYCHAYSVNRYFASNCHKLVCVCVCACVCAYVCVWGYCFLHHVFLRLLILAVVWNWREGWPGTVWPWLASSLQPFHERKPVRRFLDPSNVRWPLPLCHNGQPGCIWRLFRQGPHTSCSWHAPDNGGGVRWWSCDHG